MDKLKNINKELIIIIFLLIGPFLDVASFYNLPFNILIRGSYLLVLTLILLRKSEDKKLLWLLIIYSLLEIIIQRYYLDFSITISVSNVFRYLYLPISILFFKDYKFEKINRNTLLVIIVLLYTSIYLLSYITGIGSNAYLESDGKSGFKGVFTSINEFSAIIAGLLPIIFIFLKEKKRYILILIIFIFTLICSMLIGTKILFGGLVFASIYLLFRYRDQIFFKQKQNIKIIMIVSFILIVILSIYLFTKTRVYQNMLVQQEFFRAKKILSYDFLNYVVFNNRLTFLNNSFIYFINSKNIITYLFGLGINNYVLKLVEIDVFDVIFRYGLIGIILYIFTFIKGNINKLNIEDKISLIIFIVISLTSGHVLFYPSVSIYLGLLFTKK